MDRRLHDLFPTRRDVLKWGGVALSSVWFERVTWPLSVRASGAANPRGTARNCILIEMGGAMSQMDCWDFKETRYTPKDLDVRKAAADIYLSKTFFPQLSEQVDRLAFVRSMRSPELVHFNGQYHTQTGRAQNVAVAKEIPAFGTVVAAELDSSRRESDTFPPYVSTFLTRARAGSIGSGFFPARFAAFDLDPLSVFQSFAGNREGVDQLLERRWNLLGSLAEVSRAERASLGVKASDYKAFYKEAYRILNDPRWAAVFKAAEDERQRYGEDEFGLGCILARNLLSADAGTRFVYIYDGDRWDHHSYIFDRNRPGGRNHYATCNRLDKGLSSLLKDLSSLPGHEPAKTMLDETLIVATSEFGRTPDLNPVQGRDHYRFTYSALFAGGGVKGGRAIGRTNDDGSQCIDTGWKHKEQPQMDNIVATIYSALGVDWTKTAENTPSGRSYHYIETAPIGGAEFITNDVIDELFQ